MFNKNRIKSLTNQITSQNDHIDSLSKHRTLIESENEELKSYKEAFGRRIRHIGIEIKEGEINVHSEEQNKLQGRLLEILGCVISGIYDNNYDRMKSYYDEFKNLSGFSLKEKTAPYIVGELLCNNWIERLEVIKQEIIVSSTE